MEAFLVRGTFRAARRWTKFAKEIAAANADDAVERVMSDLGSKHRLRRASIKISGVTPIPPDQVRDPVVRYRVGARS